MIYGIYIKMVIYYQRFWAWFYTLNLFLSPLPSLTLFLFLQLHPQNHFTCGSNVEEIIHIIDEKQDFNGLSLSANFASYPPFCSIDEMGNPKGLMYDILKIVAGELNLTLKISETQPRNKGIWLKK